MGGRRRTVYKLKKEKSGIIAGGSYFVASHPYSLLWQLVIFTLSLWQFYAFSTFAMQLNELEKSMEGVIPLTDSRLRPDIRAMENGDIGTVYDLDLSSHCATAAKLHAQTSASVAPRFGKCREEET